MPITNRVFKSDKFSKMRVSLYEAPANPHQIIAYSYLECIEDREYNKPTDIDIAEAKKITEWVLKGGHTPSLESIHLCFNIRGISRIVSHQLVRHRIGVSIDQRTQRANCAEYLGKFATNEHYIEPPSIQNIKKNDITFEYDLDRYYHAAEAIYNSLVRNGISEDDARYIIPHNAETSMNFKVIYKALQHICSVRLCRLMQSEIIEITKLMYLSVCEYDQLLGDWLRPNCINTGICNRNENNPTDDSPLGVCGLTISGSIKPRDRDDTFKLTQFSKDGTK